MPASVSGASSGAVGPSLIIRGQLIPGSSGYRPDLLPCPPSAYSSCGAKACAEIGWSGRGKLDVRRVAGPRGKIDPAVILVMRRAPSNTVHRAGCRAPFPLDLDFGPCHVNYTVPGRRRTVIIRYTYRPPDAYDSLTPPISLLLSHLAQWVTAYKLIPIARYRTGV